MESYYKILNIDEEWRVYKGGKMIHIAKSEAAARKFIRFRRLNLTKGDFE